MTEQTLQTEHQQVAAETQTQPQQQRNTFPPEVPINSLFKLLGIHCNKTEFCRHRDGCIQSVVQSFCDSFVLGYLTKTAISLVFSLKKVFKNPKFIFSVLFSKDSLSFGMFLGTFSSIFKAVICLCRRKWGNSSKPSILAGFLAGCISILFLHQKTRQNLALFLLTRAFDTIYNSLIQKGIIPKWKYDYVFLYSLMMTVTGYCYGNEPGCLTPDMNKFYLSFTNQSINDYQMRQIWIERKNQELMKKGIAPHNPLDYMPKLKKFYQQKGII